jgi:plastocyanin
LKKSYQIINFLVALAFFFSVLTVGNGIGYVSVLAISKNNDVIAMISNSRYDVTYYPLKLGDTLIWSNHDNMDHKIKITKNTTGELISESKTIKPYSNFSHTFDAPGMYRYSDPLNSEMGGFISVTNDILTSIASKNMKNNVDIQLTREPIKPNTEKSTNFLIDFVNSKTKNDQEHIDYDFIIYSVSKDGQYNQMYKQTHHSDEGVEQATYKFLKPGLYVLKITIYDILFNPINPDVATFNVAVSE